MKNANIVVIIGNQREHKIKERIKYTLESTGMNITVIMNQSYGKSSENYMKSMIDKSNFIIRLNAPGLEKDDDDVIEYLGYALFKGKLIFSYGIHFNDERKCKIKQYDDSDKFIIYGGRQSGKTTKLIELSNKNKVSILTTNTNMVNEIFKMSDNMGLLIPPVFVIESHKLVCYLHDTFTKICVRAENTYELTKNKNIDLYVDDANLNKYYDELDMYNINVVGKVICTDDSPIITISSPFNSNISSTF